MRLIVSFLVLLVLSRQLHAEGFSSLVSTDEFRTLAGEIAPKVNLFRDTWAVDPNAEFYGGTSRDYLYWLKRQFREVKSRDEAVKKMADLRQMGNIDIRDILIGESDVDIVSNRTFAFTGSTYGVKKIDTISPDIFNPQTQKGKNEIDQGHIPVEKIRLTKSGVKDWPTMGDGLSEVHSGKITVQYADPQKFAETEYAKLGINHPILLAARYLRQLAMSYFQEHGREFPDLRTLLSIDPKSETETRKVIRSVQDRTVLGPYLARPKFKEWLNGSMQKAFRSYTNPTAAMELFKFFELDKLVSQYGGDLDPINQYLFARPRDPAANGKIVSHGGDPNTVFMKPEIAFPNLTAYHGVKLETNFWSLLRQGVIPSEAGSAGPGFYTVDINNINFAIKWGGDTNRVVTTKVSSDARIVDITRGDGKKLFDQFVQGKGFINQQGEEAFCKEFDIDVLLYPYNGQRAFVVKNSSVLSRPTGYIRNIITIGKMMELAKSATTWKEVTELLSMSRYGHISDREMIAIIQNSTLINTDPQLTKEIENWKQFQLPESVRAPAIRTLVTARAAEQGHLNETLLRNSLEEFLTELARQESVLGNKLSASVTAFTDSMQSITSTRVLKRIEENTKQVIARFPTVKGEIGVATREVFKGIKESLKVPLRLPLGIGFGGVVGGLYLFGPEKISKAISAIGGIGLGLFLITAVEALGRAGDALLKQSARSGGFFGGALFGKKVRQISLGLNEMSKTPVLDETRLACHRTLGLIR